MSYICADPRTCRGLSRGCCHVVWSTEWWELRDSPADLSQRWQEIRQGIRTRALRCIFMLWANEKGEFFRVESMTSISRCEWTISARASCTSKILRLVLERKVMQENTLLWYRVNLWVSQTMLNHNQTLFLIVSYCSVCMASLQKFLKGKSDAYISS